MSNLCVNNNMFDLEEFLIYLSCKLNFSIDSSLLLSLRELIIFDNKLLLSKDQIASFLVNTGGKVTSNNRVSHDCAVLMLSLFRMFVEYSVITR